MVCSNSQSAANVSHLKQGLGDARLEHRSNSVLIVAPLSVFETCGYVAPLPCLKQNLKSGTGVLVEGGVSRRLTPQSFITRIVRDRLVGKPSFAGLGKSSPSSSQNPRSWTECGSKFNAKINACPR